MKVFDLGCAAGHAFEGWFASAVDYESQQARALVRCPVCDSASVRKLPSAPHLNLGNAAQPTEQVTGSGSKAPSAPAGGAGASTAVAAPSPELRAKVLETLQRLINETEDVGTQFAEVARKMHYGEDEARNIRGVTTPEERAELEDEGIDVLTLPWIGPPKGDLQ